DLTWYDELGFDGVAVQAKHEFMPGFTPFAVAGAFPLYNTALNYPNTGTVNGSVAGANLSSTDKYLFGGQMGLAWQATPEVGFKFGAG
ncbi:putative porin, partial [Staphylococcus aureus]